MLPWAVLSSGLQCLLKICLGGSSSSCGGSQVLGGGLEARKVETRDVLCDKICPITFIFQERMEMVQDSLVKLRC